VGLRDISLKLVRLIVFMKYVKLGWSGTKVSQLCLGTWHLPVTADKDEYGVPKINEELFMKIAKKAYDAGVNFFDTSNRYHGAMAPVDLNHVGNAEKLLGRFLKSVDRDSVVVATKVRGQMAPWVNGEGLSRKHIRWQLKRSLERLGTDYIDLYQLHWPDPLTTKTEILRTLDWAVADGYVNYIGVSNHSASDIASFMELAAKGSLEPFVSSQDLYNVLDRNLEVEKGDVLKRFDMSVLAYSPLAQGVLTGKYIDPQSEKWVIPEGSRAERFREIERYFNDRNLKILLEMKEIAASKGATVAQVALAWLLTSGQRLGFTTVPIVGVTKLEQLEEDLGSIDLRLSQDDMKRLDEAYRRTA